MRGKILFGFILCSVLSIAQNETNIWYFGDNAGINFNSGAPVPLLDGQLVTNEGCASIANQSGQLLFYTDGVTVWNKNHNIMLNGSGLNGSFTSTNSAIIIPKPNNSNIYYIFTVDAEAGSNGLQYSEVDITLDSGLGGITMNKNVPLIAPTSEKLTAVKNPNLNEYWVVSHKWESDEFVAYTVDSGGVNNAPVVSAAGSYIGGSDPFITIGHIKISPDGSKLAVANHKPLRELQLMDFDATTGIVSNATTLLNYTTDKQIYGVEFSSNSKLLYTSVVGTGVFQFNLQAGSSSDIYNSRLSISSIPSAYAALQLASDGKIYVAKAGQTNIDVIGNPNIIGTGCNYQFEGLYLGSRVSKAGLPPFIQSFLQIEDIQFENTCIGNTTNFSYTSTVDNIVWDFGNALSGSNNTSTSLNPTHTYSSPGTYTVSATVTIGTQTATTTTQVTIHEQPTANKPQDILVCDTNNDGFFNFDLTTQNLSILNGQDPSVFTIEYLESLIDYNASNAITNPSNYLNTSAYGVQNIVASIKNINNNICVDLTNFNIQVFEQALPSTTIPNIETCDNISFGSDSDGMVIADLTQNESIILNGQSASNFSIEYYTDAALTNQITTPTTYQNTASNETIYVQVTNNGNNLCEAQANFNLIVHALPIINTSAQLNQCDDDVDGFSAFNLNEVIGEITNNSATETITFHESLNGSINNTELITNTTSYINQTNSNDTVWVRVENSSGCFATAELNLTVTTTQIPSSFIRNFFQCDDGTNLYDGIATFDFSSVDIEIQNMFPVGQVLNIKYYKNQQDALAENDPILDISNYTNSGYPDNQAIYVRVDSAVNNDCLGLGQHINLIVDNLPLQTNPIIINQCDVGNDGVESIDTSNINNQLIQGQANIVLEFRDSSGLLLSNPLPNPFVTGSQTLDVTIINSSSQDPDGFCEIITQIDIIVDAGVIAHPVPEFNVCDTNNDGVFEFDTTNIEFTLLNGQTGVVISYVDNLGNALSSPLPNPFITSSQTITATLVNPVNNLCFDQTDIIFMVNSVPTAFPISSSFVCDDTSNDGESLFNLLDFNSQILNGQSTSQFNITYHATQSDANNGSPTLPFNYLCSTDSETIFARIENVDNENCYDTTIFTIGVSYMPIAYQPSNLWLCDDDTNDGKEVFNLNNQDLSVLNGQTPSENNISYHLSNTDALTGLNALNNDFENTSNPQTIFVRIENLNNENCYSTTSFLLEVYEQPILTLPNSHSICENDSVILIANSGYDNYLWSTGETSEQIEVFTPGDYSVTVTNNYPNGNCSITKSTTVLNSNVATILDVQIQDWSNSNNSITVIVEGDGDYEYSLNGFSYQDSNIFSNLENDDYRVYVSDKNGCGIAEKEVFLLFYPNFFTPNNDGYNDYWQLYNASKESKNVINIFDRYGKLIKQLSPLSKGWDGTYKGQQLPTNDYWFKLLRENGKSYTGHFTLKR